MENLMRIITAGLLAMTVGTASAECPNHLSVDQMYDCIVVEGAGDIYTPPETAQQQAPAKSQQDAASSENASDDLADASSKQ